MKQLYCVICGMHLKFRNPKVLYVLKKKKRLFILFVVSETRNHFHEERQQNELMSRKHKKVCTTLNYI